jgi:hypothetical protein
MSTEEEKIRYVIEHTEILRAPKQRLSTFGVTNLHYYLVTEPSYAELVNASEACETVVREGKVAAENPKIVTPHYLFNLFEGFEHGREYAEFLLRKHGPHEPGLMYRYRNEPRETSIVSSPLRAVVERLSGIIDMKEEHLAVIIKGVDEMWDISLMKFIHDITADSLRSNILDLGRRGLLDMDQSSVPRDAREGIEELFRQVENGENDPSRLKVELDRWGLFPEYEDRFLSLFKRRRG